MVSRREDDLWIGERIDIDGYLALFLYDAVRAARRRRAAPERSRLLKRPILRIPIVVGLLVSLCAVALNFSAGVVSGAPAPRADTSGLFFPWVPNGETMDGAGPWYGSVTVQNLENFRVAISFSDSAGSKTSGGTTLEAHAAQTFSADDLGISSPGGGASVAASWDFSPPGQVQRLVDAGICTYKYDAVTDTLVHQTSGGVDLLGQPVDTRYLSSIVVTQTINGNTVTYQQGVDFNVIDQQLPTGPTVGALDWSPSGQEPGTGTPFDVTFIPAAP